MPLYTISNIVIEKRKCLDEAYSGCVTQFTAFDSYKTCIVDIHYFNVLKTDCYVVSSDIIALHKIDNIIEYS